MLLLQARTNREASPNQTGSDPRSAYDHTARLTIVTDAAERPAQGGAASYGASRMGISPHQQPGASLLNAASDAESLEESMPSRSPSPAAAEQRSRSTPALAAQSGSNAITAQAGVVSPTASRRVGILRGGPVAGAYSDGRQVTTGSQELPSHIGYGFESEDRFNRSAARKAEAVRYAAGLAANKQEPSSSRASHVSPPGRLIITSGDARTPSGRPAVHAGSGDLNRPRQAKHAEQLVNISVVKAPVQSSDPAQEAEDLQPRTAIEQVVRAPADQSSPQGVASQDPPPRDGSDLQQAGQSESAQQDDMSRAVSSGRVDSLSGWASPAQLQESAAHSHAPEAMQTS